MYTITRKTIGDMHDEIVKLIVERGEEIKTEDNELTLELFEPLHVHIDEPLSPPMISPSLPYGERFMDVYVEEMMVPKPTNFTYLYSNRFWDYPVYTMDGRRVGDGKGKGINQILACAMKLKSNPQTRRAISVSLVPEVDVDSHDPPCIDLLQFFARGGKINLIAYIRSNDMLLAWGCNAYALAYLLKWVADYVSADVGWLETISASAHIYYKRDQNYLDNFRKRLRI